MRPTYPSRRALAARNYWPLLLAAVLILIQPVGLHAQPITTVPIHITSTPEMISTLYAVTHANNLGKHNVLLCNDGQLPADIPKERVLQALKDLPVLDVTEANILLRESYNKNWKFSVARYAEYALIITGIAASGGTGAVVNISTKGMSKIIGGIGVAHVLGDRLKGEVPSLDPFLANTLTDTIHLGPAGSANQCVSRVVFTGIIRGVHGYDVIAQMPVAPILVPAAAKVAEIAPQPLTEADQQRLVATVTSLSLWQHQ